MLMCQVCRVSNFTPIHVLSLQPLLGAVKRTITDLSVCMCVQYGGSEAHSTFFQRQRGDWEAATQSRDLMTSIRRFYSNAYTDAEKQDAINLFLGNFVPHHGHAALWELDSDYFLHAGMDTRLMAVVNGGCMQLLWLFVIQPQFTCFHTVHALDLLSNLQFVYSSFHACTELCSTSVQNCIRHTIQQLFDAMAT